MRMLAKASRSGVFFGMLLLGGPAAAQSPEDLARLEALPIRRIEVEIDLERKRVGVSDTLLPARASVQVHLFPREVQMNQIEFRGCKEFGTESTIRYDGGEAEEVAEPAVPKPAR